MKNEQLKKLYKDYSDVVFSLQIFKKENNNNVICGSGTCFLVGKYLITNYHVLEPILGNLEKNQYFIVLYGATAKDVEVEESNGQKVVQTYGAYSFSSEELKLGLTDCRSNDANNDYIILDLGIWACSNIPVSFGKIDKIFKNSNPLPIKNLKVIEFKIGDSSDVYIGQQVVFFGYPFGKRNLSMHTGIISSIYDKNGIKVFQIDGSVNNGNSGGPLIDIETGEIIGLISRKEDGLNQLFDDLKKTIKLNVATLSQPYSQGVRLNGIDTNRALNISFKNLDSLVNQIERSANVGIGYAFSMDKIKEDINFLNGV